MLFFKRHKPADIGEQHELIEELWVRFGPQGAAAAGIAIVAISHDRGYCHAIGLFFGALGGLFVWFALMALLRKDNPNIKSDAEDNKPVDEK